MVGWEELTFRGSDLGRPGTLQTALVDELSMQI
jgi:hypothetical protein